MSSLDNRYLVDERKSNHNYSQLERHMHKSPTCNELSPERPLTILWGEFEVGDLVGSGSFGHVYRCRSVKNGKYYAIKKFKNKYPTKKKAFEQREIQILQRFDQNKRTHCPYIMKAERIEYDNQRLYLVFECMDMSLT
jgi:serine/threonine protein kinase